MLKGAAWKCKIEIWANEAMFCMLGAASEQEFYFSSFI